MASSPSGDSCVIPYRSGQDNSINVAFDSLHPLRRIEGDWHGYQFGELLIPSNTGTFPGGVHVGDSFSAGDILTYFDYNLIKLGALPFGTQREIVTVFSPWPGKNVPGSQGYTDFFAKLEAVDYNSNQAYYSEGIMLFKEVSTGVTYSKTRVNITWPELS